MRVVQIRKEEEKTYVPMQDITNFCRNVRRYTCSVDTLYDLRNKMNSYLKYGCKVTVTDTRDNTSNLINTCDDFLRIVGYTSNCFGDFCRIVEHKGLSDFINYKVTVTHKRTLTCFERRSYIEEYTWEAVDDNYEEGFLLEIYDKYTKKLLITKKYKGFDRLLNFAQTKLDPSHPKFDPSNICVNRYCKVLVNSIDVSGYFIDRCPDRISHDLSWRGSFISYSRSVKGNVRKG